LAIVILLSRKDHSDQPLLLKMAGFHPPLTGRFCPPPDRDERAGVERLDHSTGNMVATQVNRLERGNDVASDVDSFPSPRHFHYNAPNIDRRVSNENPELSASKKIKILDLLEEA